MVKGTLYGAGVGPGDPELITVKAARLIRENEVIAFRGTAENSLAYQIAVQAVPGLEKKELLPVSSPMIRDRQLLEESRREAAGRIERILDEGRNVVYITLGDPAVYCSFSYLQHILEEDGYRTELVPGVTSFSAAAARLGIPLAEWDEPVHIMPALHNAEEGALLCPGNYVLMKSAGKMHDVKVLLSRADMDVMAVENCGMDGEAVYRSLEEIPDDAGYFTLIIAKEKNK